MTTTVSFRVDEELVKRLDEEASRSGTTRSDLLQRAVAELTYRLSCERDAEGYRQQPFTAQEAGGAGQDGRVADAPAPDWSEFFGE